MIGRVRESRNPKKVIRVALMESYGEIRRVPVNLFKIILMRLYLLFDIDPLRTEENREDMIGVHFTA